MQQQKLSIPIYELVVVFTEFRIHISRTMNFGYKDLDGTNNIMSIFSEAKTYIKGVIIKQQLTSCTCNMYRVRQEEVLDFGD